MNRIGKFIGTVGHLIAVVVVVLLGLGDTPRLRKRLDEEGRESVG